MATSSEMQVAAAAFEHARLRAWLIEQRIEKLKAQLQEALTDTGIARSQLADLCGLDARSGARRHFLVGTSTVVEVKGREVQSLHAMPCLAMPQTTADPPDDEDLPRRAISLNGDLT
jgi:hypothetical protein